MRYETPAAFRQAIEARLQTRSQETGAALDRLRRRVVFERLLARLLGAQTGRWVLKGGMALEFRMGDQARATKDLDLAVGDVDSDRDAVLSALAQALAEDVDGDSFDFLLSDVSELSPDEAGRPGWRIRVEARLAGRTFARVSLDVVSRWDEITGVETITPASVLDFADLPILRIEVINRNQHFAEKVHAMTRSYGDRPSSRARDLADLMILLEDGVTADEQLAVVLQHVFSTRQSHALPQRFSDPPASWNREYGRLAANLDLGETTVENAMQKLSEFWGLIPLEHSEE